MKKQNSDVAPGEGSSRRGFLQSSLIGGVAAAVFPALGAARVTDAATPAVEVKAFELEEITIDQLQAGMKSGKYTARSIAETRTSTVAAVSRVNVIDRPLRRRSRSTTRSIRSPMSTR